MLSLTSFWNLLTTLRSWRFLFSFTSFNSLAFCVKVYDTWSLYLYLLIFLNLKYFLIFLGISFLIHRLFRCVLLNFEILLIFLDTFLLLTSNFFHRRQRVCSMWFHLIFTETCFVSLWNIPSAPKQNLQSAGGAFYKHPLHASGGQYYSDPLTMIFV